MSRNDTGSCDLEQNQLAPQGHPAESLRPQRPLSLSNASLFEKLVARGRSRMVIFWSSRRPRATSWSCSSNNLPPVNHSIGSIVAAMLHANCVLYSRPREPVLPWWSWIVAPSTGILDRWRITRHAATRHASPSGRYILRSPYVPIFDYLQTKLWSRRRAPRCTLVIHDRYTRLTYTIHLAGRHTHVLEYDGPAFERLDPLSEGTLFDYRDIFCTSTELCKALVESFLFSGLEELEWWFFFYYIFLLFVAIYR